MEYQKILIIGGVAAGASAAARASRTAPAAKITMIEKGPYISFANCGLPYFLSGEVRNRGDLVIRTPGDFKERYNVDVLVNTEAFKIDRPSKTVHVRDLMENREHKLYYDKLILAMGAYTFMPSIPGLDAENVFTLRTIPDVDAIYEYIQRFNPRRAVVLGGGYIGIEAADVLRKRGLDVSVVEMKSHMLPMFDADMAEYLHEEMGNTGVGMILGSGVKEILKDPSGKGCQVLTNDGRRQDADIIIANLGIRPNTGIARNAGLETGEYALMVDDYLRTTDPDIYAAGDMIQVKDLVTSLPTWSPLAGPANQQGKIAGANASGENIRYKGVIRSSIVQFNDLALAKTGLTEKEATESGIDNIAVTVHSTSHAGYYPGSSKLHAKVVAKGPTGQILGAQVAGKKGADKRIDVFAACITARMTVRDLEFLDLAYSPQFSHSIDIVNIAGSLGVKKLENGSQKKQGSKND